MKISLLTSWTSCKEKGILTTKYGILFSLAPQSIKLHQFSFILQNAYHFCQINNIPVPQSKLSLTNFQPINLLIMYTHMHTHTDINLCLNCLAFNLCLCSSKCCLRFSSLSSSLGRTSCMFGRQKWKQVNTWHTYTSDSSTQTQCTIQ